MPLTCPICQNELKLNDKTWHCINNHQFDQAKEGYVNLLPVHFKHSKNPGDDKQMLQARQQFLHAEHYQPLAHQLIKLVSQQTPYAAIVDMGCGEGYYTNYLSALSEHVWGVDISKVGIRYAAKHAQSNHFVVASNQRLPFKSQSIELMTRIFAPQHDDEVLRCLAPDGFLLTVTPGPWHLKELREQIYQDVRAHNDAPENILGLLHVQSEYMNYTMDLNANDRQYLMSMTPFAWKLSALAKQRFLEDRRPVTAEFTLHLYQKTADPH